MCGSTKAGEPHYLLQKPRVGRGRREGGVNHAETTGQSDAGTRVKQNAEATTHSEMTKTRENQEDSKTRGIDSP